MNKNIYLLLGIALGIAGAFRLYEAAERYSKTGTVPWLALLSAVLFLALAVLQIRRYRHY